MTEMMIHVTVMMTDLQTEKTEQHFVTVILEMMMSSMISESLAVLSLVVILVAAMADLISVMRGESGAVMTVAPSSVFQLALMWARVTVATHSAVLIAFLVAGKAVLMPAQLVVGHVMAAWQHRRSLCPVPALSKQPM